MEGSLSEVGTRNQIRKMRGFGGELREVEYGSQVRRRYSQRSNPPGADRDLSSGRGVHRGGAHSHGKWRKTQSFSAGRRDNLWRLMSGSAGDIQVGGALCRERRWGAGENNRGLQR